MKAAGNSETMVGNSDPMIATARRAPVLAECGRQPRGVPA